MSTSDRDNKLAHDLIAEYADRDNMGRLREAIATALTTARTKQAERDAVIVGAMATEYERQGKESLKDDDVQAWCRGEVNAANEIAAAIRAAAKEGEGK